MKRCLECGAVISTGHEVYVKHAPYHTDCAPAHTAELGGPNIMSMHKKLQAQMRQGVILERDRTMRILFKIATNTKEGLDKKLMAAGEKHVAELRFKIAEGLIAAVQMMVMSGEDPDAEAEARQIHGQDPDALGDPQGSPDGGSAG